MIIIHCWQAGLSHTLYKAHNVFGISLRPLLLASGMSAQISESGVRWKHTLNQLTENTF
jgi:hypothetical protein